MQTTRRQFFWFSAGASLGVGSLEWLNAGEQTGLQSATRKSWALGSDVAITALHQKHSTAKQAIDAAFDELQTVEKLMSLYREDSQLSRLNRKKSLDDPHPYFVDVLRAAQTMSKRTKGAFDATVQPLWAIYAAGKKRGQTPHANTVKAARKKIDWRRVEISEQRIRLRGQGTEITLNGIAQGYAADRAKAAIEAHGVKQALIDTGEVSSLGQKSSGDTWSIGIQHPRVKDAYISVAKLEGRCLATSGDYATEFTKDCQLNHLFDPRTGYSPTELASVSICAKTAMQADALSTATFVLGPEQGMKLLSKTPGADALMVLKSGKVLVSKEFPVES